MRDRFWLGAVQGPFNRRQLLKVSALGGGGSVLAGLLAACGGSSSSPTTSAATSAATSASAGSAQTATTQALPTAQVNTGQASPAASPQASSSATAAGTSTSSAGTPKKGGDFVIVGHQELAGLSPNDTGPGDQWVMITQIHNALVEMDENYVFNPLLAEKFDVAPDSLTYTFNLRQGVKFHDGSEFTAADAKYTFEFYSDATKGSVIANNFQNMDTVAAPDDATIVVKMKAPNAAFIARGATTFIVQSKYHAQVGEKTYRTKPIGTGAFKLKEWVSSDHTTVEAFADHFRGAPHLNTVTQKLVPEPSVRKVALDTGNADSACWPLLVQDDLALNKETDKFTNFTTVTIACNHFPINNRRPYFSQKEVRQALMYAIDRQKVIDTVFQGAATLATANMVDALKAWYNPNVQKYDYNPDKAKQMLDAAGWTVGADGVRAKDGQKFSFTCLVISGDQARKPEAELVQQYLKAVNIDMQIAEQPATQIYTGLINDKADASLYNWTYGGSGGDPDGSVTLGSKGGNNWSSYNSPQMDQLLEQGLKETDPAKRKQIYDQIQALVAEDVPFIFMMYWQWFNHFSKKTKGLPPSALSANPIYRKANEWWFE
ncbi:MAG TPA: ABC transporter substrate-binding protein [Thermomicrobiaceae bacterium]|nr:ABC transporter substrate-binding protein [Thermomicrobiaceae bacterium]